VAGVVGIAVLPDLETLGGRAVADFDLQERLSALGHAFPGAHHLAGDFGFHGASVSQRGASYFL
jgi:hypothetical protein